MDRRGFLKLALAAPLVAKVAPLLRPKMEMIRYPFEWQPGPIVYSVGDWRHVVRIANIDVSTLVAAEPLPDIVRLMVQAKAKIEDSARL